MTRHAWIMLACAWTILIAVGVHLLTDGYSNTYHLVSSFSRIKPQTSKKDMDPPFLTMEDAPKIMPGHVDCSALMKGDKKAIALAERFQMRNNSWLVLTDQEMEVSALDCESFMRRRQYIQKPVSNEELHFPLAFSVIIYKQAHQVERLLRAIYRPQNYYCLHVDLKASSEFTQAIQAISACFENVFVPSKRLSVKWGQFTVLEAEMVCLKALWRYRKWKYFINLTGQEFPLKTNGDIVKILKVFNGANDASANLNQIWRKRRFSKIGKEDIPYGIRLGKGQVHVALSRAFVEFALHNQAARLFYHWLNDTWIPDETFFNSLNISPLAGVPGAYTGQPTSGQEDNLQVVRRKKWSFLEECHGKEVRQICIVTIYDLPDLAQSKMMFVNKLHQDYHPVAYDCLEEHLAGQVREEVMGRHTIQLDYYRKLPFVLHHASPPNNIT